MSDTSGKKKRKSRKTKEEKMLEKVTKEQKAEQENSREENNEQQRQMPFQATPEQKQLMQNTDINQKMMDMDVRIKYGFIKTLHNNLTSINRRFNWDEEELMAIGMIFRDLQSIELNVFNTVMQNEDNNEAIEEGEEEEEEEEEIEEAN
tara:strand:+ start:1060 stop:1506 length:447 start_codon:yes stop_codon:yes gene_type:complete